MYTIILLTKFSRNKIRMVCVYIYISFFFFRHYFYYITRENQTPLKLIHVFRTRQVFVFFFSIEYKNKHDKLRN